MENRHRIIKLYKPWATLPDFATLPAFVKPNQTPPNETYKEEYTEAQLRSLALENRADTLPGLSVSAASLQDLPADFFKVHYLHLRYRRALPEDYFPLRTDVEGAMRLSTSTHSLGAMICMALVLRAILLRTAVTIDPAKKREARDIGLLLREVQYAIYKTLEKYPTGMAPDNLVIGSYTQILRFQSVVEQTYWVLFDEDLLADYVAAGNTVEEAIDHWVANQTQPEW